MKNFKIGELVISWESENFPVLLDEYITKFLIDEKDIKKSDKRIIYKMKEANLNRIVKEKLITYTGGYELYETDQGKFLLYHWAKCRFAYGFYEKDIENSNEICIYYNPEIKNEIPVNAVRFFSTIGIHSRFLKNGSIILHSAHITYKGKSILFTAPSGTGKSTQAKLWVKYRQAVIINEDRTLISLNDNNGISSGYPCCGSSEICLNQSAFIRCIVVLQQGQENKIQKMTLSEIIRTLLSATELYRWNVNEIDRAIQIIRELADTTTIIRLICKADEDAVAILENYLEDE